MNPIYLADLNDDDARQLDATARTFYLRVLVLVNDTGCDVATAIQAVQAAQHDEEPER